MAVPDMQLGTMLAYWILIALPLRPEEVIFMHVLEHLLVAVGLYMYWPVDAI